MILYETRESVARVGAPVLGDKNDNNYRSFFGFPSSTQDLIKKQGHVKDLDGQELYCDEILVDVDDNSSIDATLAAIKKSGVKHTVYTTGNRGCHISIPIEPIQHRQLVYSVKQYVKSLGIWDYIDTSVFRAAGQFRAVGARHEKTGKHKSVLYEVEGNVPKLRIMAPPPLTHAKLDVNHEPTEQDKFQLYINMLAARGPGTRTPHFYILWRSCIRAGVSNPTEIILWWNSRQSSPHSDKYVINKIRGFR
jgi:hypothetical protein